LKSFQDLVVIKQPQDLLWVTVRDHLPELASQLDDIESVEVLEREETGGGRVRLVNRWRSTQTIPSMLRDRLGASEVSWVDRNEWDGASRVCTWTIEPSLLRDSIHCAGTTTYQRAMGGRGTRVTFAGEFEFAPGALRSIAGPLERPLAAFIESIVKTLIPRNLRRVMEAAAKRIADEQR